MSSPASSTLEQTGDPGGPGGAAGRVARVERIARLAAAGLVVLAVILVPLVALQRGWLPRDDARRHAAFAVTAPGTTWDQVVVIRRDAARDQHPRWHALLRGVHDATGADAPTLLVLSIIGLAWIAGLAPLPLVARAAGSRAPATRTAAWPAVSLAAWPAAVALTFAASPTVLSRWVSGRPLVVSMAALLVVLLAWRQAPAGEARRRPFVLLAGTTAAIATATALHGTWYLFALPVGATFLARPRALADAAQLAACWLAGSAAGAALAASGNPIPALLGSVHHALLTIGPSAAPAPPWRVSELEPSGGEPWVVALVLAWVVARRVLRRRHDGDGPGAAFLDEWRDPAFVLAALGWLLGLRVQRFWHDWGAMGLMAWLAADLHRVLATAASPPLPEPRAPHSPGWRAPGLGLGIGVAVTALASVALVLVTAMDRHGRWSATAHELRLSASDPGLAGWLPDPGGVLYNERMADFYSTFLENPRAPWRYQLGFEPGLMTPEDLAVYRSMQEQSFQLMSFQPWLEKLRPQDRLLLRWPGDGSVVTDPPPVPGIEWARAGSDAWLGRLPRGRDRWLAPDGAAGAAHGAGEAGP